MCLFLVSIESVATDNKNRFCDMVSDLKKILEKSLF